MFNKRVVASALLAVAALSPPNALAAVHGNTMSSGPASPSFRPISEPGSWARTVTGRSGPPKGWNFVSNVQRYYETWTDIAQGLPVGTRFLGIRRAPYVATGTNLSRMAAVPAAEFATVMQGISADKYRGRRIRLSAQLSTREVAGQAALWMRIDGQNGKVLGIDRMATRAITGTTNWNRQEIVLDVPSETATIEVGVLLAGSGEVMAAQFKLDAVDASTPVTASGVPPASDALPTTLVDLDQHP